jgi:hypothetical protein
MTRYEIRALVRSVLLNDTEKWYDRQELLEKSNDFIGLFHGSTPLEMTCIEQAVLDLAFGDGVIHISPRGLIKMNMDAFAQWVIDNA